MPDICKGISNSWFNNAKKKLFCFYLKEGKCKWLINAYLFITQQSQIARFILVYILKIKVKSEGVKTCCKTKGSWQVIFDLPWWYVKCEKGSTHKVYVTLD